MKEKVVFCVVLFVLLFCGQMLSTPPAHAQVTCTSNETPVTYTAAGGWDCNQVPTINDIVIIQSGHNKLITGSGGDGFAGTLTVNGTLRVGNNATIRALTVGGDITVGTGGSLLPALNATLNVTHQVNIGGNLTNNGTFDARDTDGSGAIHSFNTTFTGSITQTISGSSPARFNSLTVNDTAVVVVPAGATQPTVEGTLTNNGTLVQERPVVSATVPFLEIRDFAGTAVKYRGVEVTSAADLGDVTVLVEKVNYNSDEFCTTSGDNSPVYADRCFTITPDTSDTAVIRLYALNPGELNNIAVDDLAVYRHIPTSGWVKLSTLENSGTVDGGVYAFAEGETPGFSSFLMADTIDSPTAVTLQTFTAANNTAWLLIISIIIMVLALVTARVFLNRRA